MRRTPNIEPALMSADVAARYLGISRSNFDDAVRPFIPVVDMRRPDGKIPIPRYAKADLDAFWTARRKERKVS